MRKLWGIAVMIIFTLSLAGGVSASSFGGWIGVPGFITLGKTTIELRDVSLDDGSLMMVLSNGSSSSTLILKPGQNLTFGRTTLTYLRLLVNSESLVLLKVNFSYVFPGQNITFGDYRISLLSIGSSGAKLRVSKGNQSKDFTSSDFTFKNVHVRVSAYPKVFDGYLKRGGNVSAYGYTLTFSNATVENTTGGLVETVIFTYKNDTYPVEVGKEADVGVFHVKVEDLAGVDYAKVVVNFIGASVDVERVPDMTFTLSPGQTQKVGPYVLKYEDYFEGATVSLRNPCGKVLSSARLSTASVSTLLYYGGVAVGLESVTTDGTATFFALVDEARIPRVDKVANLLISVSSEGGKQYAPMTVSVRVKNTGTVDLSNVSLKFVPAGDVELISKGSWLLSKIKPDEEKTLQVELLPHRSGNLTLGHVEAKAVAPFELACGGYTVLNFRSNDLRVNVEPSRVSYGLRVESSNRTLIYHPLVVNITVTNTGDVSVPANLTVSLPQGVAVEPNGVFSSAGNLMIAPLSLLPGENATLSLRVIPYIEGTKELDFRVETPLGVVNSSALSLHVATPPTSPKNETPVTVTETTTAPCNGTATVTETHTTTHTETKTETKTKTSVTTSISPVPYTPVSSKVLWSVLGFVLGVLVIITFAWYQARKG